MQESTTDVRRDIEETRARVTQTLAELEGEIASRTDAVKDRVAGARDSVSSIATQAQSAVTDFAREHPWYALGAALGIGLVIARSGADEAAARAAVGGTSSAAKGISGAAAGAARAGVDKAKGLVHRGSPGEDHGASIGGHAVGHDPAVGAIGSSAEDTGELDAASRGGIFYRLQTGLVEAVTNSDLVAEMRREAEKIGNAGRGVVGAPVNPS